LIGRGKRGRGKGGKGKGRREGGGVVAFEGGGGRLKISPPRSFLKVDAYDSKPGLVRVASPEISRPFTLIFPVT